MFSRDSSKALLALAITALLALGLAACGGDGGTTGSTTATSPGGESTATTGTGETGSGGSKGAESFFVPGGDNSIPEYGEEADGDEVAAAEAVLDRYFDARAARDWAKTCGYLSKEAVEPLEELAQSTPQLKGADCAELLEKLQGSVPKSSLANPMTSGLAALRVEEGRGFALFHGAKGADYFILLSGEGEDWTVSALAPSEFP